MIMNSVRKAIESLYVGLCSITNSQAVFDETTKRTTFKDVVLVENEPCRLSFSTVKETSQTETVGEVGQVVKLFIRPELEIKAGSKITVTQNGRTTKYIASGQPAVHTNHQEIVLVLEDDKA